MKLLIYSHEFPPFQGGLATSSMKLVRGLSGQGFDVAALVPSYGGSSQKADGALPAKIIRVPLLGHEWVKKAPLLQYILGWLWFQLSLIHERPQAVLFITEEAEVVGGLSPFYSFVPVVRVAGSGITTIFLGKRFWKRVLMYPLRRLYRRADSIIAVSESTKKLLSSVGIEGEKVSVIYNGVSDSFLSSPPDKAALGELKRLYEIAKGDPVIVTVARVLPRKGQDMVIRSLGEVVKKYPGIKYLIVGDGRYLERFRALAQDMGLERNVFFTGGVEQADIIHYYDIADLFIMPNRFWNGKVEGLPNALIEAGARAKPCIAGNQAGSVEAVEHGKSGLLVDPESTKEVAEAIISLLSNKKLSLKMGRYGRDMVRKKFAEKRMINQFVKILMSTVSS